MLAAKQGVTMRVFYTSEIGSRTLRPVSAPESLFDWYLR
jgi:hypothetical protein